MYFRDFWEMGFLTMGNSIDAVALDKNCPVCKRRSLLVWFESISLYLTFITSNARNLPPVLTYCHVNFLGNNALMNSLIYPVLVIQLATCTAYYGVNLQNKRHLAHFNLTSKSHSLAQRFALWSNVRAARWMLPVSILHCSIQMLITLVSMFLRKFLMPNRSEYYIYLSCQFCVLALESLVHPIVCIRNNEFLQRSLNTMYPSTFRIALARWIFYGRSTVAVADVKENSNVCNVIDKARRVVTTTANIGGFTGASDMNAKIVTKKNDKIVEFRQNPDQYADVLKKLWGQAK
uniref:G protein-coupled receptor n=1 Tax=Romanomermis culicivorax TaxID=13658 RepID=A0A915INF2_ROMCU